MKLAMAISTKQSQIMHRLLMRLRETQSALKLAVFLFLISFPGSGQIFKNVLQMFYEFLPIIRVISAKLICVQFVLVIVIRNSCGP